MLKGKACVGMSSPFMKPTSKGICPECGKGRLFPVVASRVYEVQGRKIRVEGLMPWECDACRERVFPASENQRAQEIIAIKLQKAAA